MKGFEGTGKPTATDRSFFEARAKLTSHEQALLTILDFEGEQDPKVEKYQMKRFYSDEAIMADMEHYKTVKAVKKTLINYPKTQVEMLITGYLMIMTGKEE